jgi:hypothetical protein
MTFPDSNRLTGVEDKIIFYESAELDAIIRFFILRKGMNGM